ncbi:NAD(P)/FAD-dependent oxidoreductase [Chelatococcus asaccharovorans]|uniref:Glycine/D-amino acid oxidase-like deaminating enzyme n=1 Tax=Chelatococcus asaccharovorans TaxID=28210 RepID=A0A2V3UVF3_9HYPH|nr:FAD-dependent oxidoreductase [Chelatococcus asaccharovorans]MBS7706642.1 FAD-binding oxidoreductase [Chelatococcus asaccharovorans]PXW64708.1 glycine/D-amino acid oxidase-like deaminating enzyme [Chelatococcus asaccharovorans]
MTLFSPEPPYGLTAVAAPATGRLTDAREVDILLVGAGYGGLLTAIELAEAGARVAVIEARDIGAGGSGRNHGQCIPVFRYLGSATLPEKGTGLLAEAGAMVFDRIARHGLRCEAVQKGTLSAAFNDRTLATTRAAQAKYARYGKSDRYLDAGEIAELTGTRAFLGGWVHRDGGHVNPLGYARELARLALSLGIEVFTDSPMTAFTRRNGRWSIRTPEGEIRARTVGLTTDAYSTAAIPGAVTRGFFPLTSYAVASRPLTTEERANVMPSGMNFGDTHHDPMFFRIDAAGRIITGGLQEPGRGRRFDYTAAFMTRRLSRIWPVLAGLNWEFMWTGTVSMALDQTPSIQRLDDGLWALSGWSGRGVPTSAALSVAFARTLEDPAAGRDWWPQRQPPRVIARALLGQMVQLCRGPFNQLRDRMEG